MKLDEIDRGILAALQENGRMSLTAIARRVNAAPATVHERLAKLRRSGILVAFSVRLDAAKLGYSVTALVHLTIELANDLEKTLEELKSIPEVEEIHVVTGEYDLVVKLRAQDSAHLQELLVSKVHRVTGFKRSATEICLTTPLERSGPRLV